MNNAANIAADLITTDAMIRLCEDQRAWFASKLEHWADLCGGAGQHAAADDLMAEAAIARLTGHDLPEDTL